MDVVQGHCLYRLYYPSPLTKSRLSLVFCRLSPIFAPFMGLILYEKQGFTQRKGRALAIYWF
ncbi:hypothetical protein GCWU000325_02548 [Alloprevotella tannerae ATCC 51259]|uniref:Uncharacterized protein n=1 Tax=Alloprevotella tannerae ATCC 51259 TaxID=626522 RepID=C9LJY4_9BACT|nr:hypothetical protein GCWU000325_02548 [Alloprevotella tannerae ATCC 51259]